MNYVMLGLALLTIVLASWGAISRSFKRSMILAWTTAMSLGLIFLLSGAEVIALVVWFMGTLLLILFYVFSSMFGDLLEKQECQELFQSKKEWALPVSGAVMTAALFGLGLLPWLKNLSVETDFHPVIFAEFSRFMLERDALTSLLLGFGILITLVGGSVIARADWLSSSEKDGT